MAYKAQQCEYIKINFETLKCNLKCIFGRYYECNDEYKAKNINTNCTLTSQYGTKRNLVY